MLLNEIIYKSIYCLYIGILLVTSAEADSLMGCMDWGEQKSGCTGVRSDVMSESAGEECKQFSGEVYGENFSGLDYEIKGG